jgi:glutaredoxin-like protein
MIKMYGTAWCGDCHRSRAFLDEKGIKYEFIDIDKDEKAMKYVEGVNKGMRSVPTIVFEDGSILVEPNNEELGKKLGIK